MGRVRGEGTALWELQAVVEVENTMGPLRDKAWARLRRGCKVPRRGETATMGIALLVVVFTIRSVLVAKNRQPAEDGDT
jgi:hypothetical protein